MDSSASSIENDATSSGSSGLTVCESADVIWKKTVPPSTSSSAAPPPGFAMHQVQSQRPDGMRQYGGTFCTSCDGTTAPDYQ
ncbi:unnamed protein product [Adineta ricciae]|uniref:Uncharacterized protein n=1 Tax=Adineta ricciae TaxID=249248 RepID=A0A816G5A0_ADIRI|nr:unnamed protein product [Adineta ricciae]